jgi:hypothetical protein
MSRKVGLIALVGVAAMWLSGCASDENVKLVRQPAMPPVVVARAAPTGPYWQNVSLQAVEGAPEFRWFDGDAVLTTRPTRQQALDVFSDDLSRVGMLAPTRVDSDYMLYVKFEDLHGPDVIWFSDKHASAAITFRLVNWRTGQVVKAKRIIAAYEADAGGLTPEAVRYAIFGPIGLANDSPLPGPVEAEDLVVRYIFLERTPISEVAQIGPANGTYRRIAAWHGLLNLAFDEFMDELSTDGSINYKRAVGCDTLTGQRVRQVERLESDRAYAVDCSDSHYLESMTHRVYPTSF